MKRRRSFNYGRDQRDGMPALGKIIQNFRAGNQIRFVNS